MIEILTLMGSTAIGALICGVMYALAAERRERPGENESRGVRDGSDDVIAEWFDRRKEKK